MKDWNPTELPYRVLTVYDDDRPGMYGWGSRHTLHATEAEARAAFDKPWLGRDRSRRIELAVNGETWTRNGKWQRVASKKRVRRPVARRSLNRAEN